MSLPLAVVALAVLAAGSTPAATVPPKRAEALLGAAPLCEASAAIPIPHAAGRVLVADNEVSESLFEFSISGGRLDGQTAWPLPAGAAPADIEAITAAGDTVWIFGSHSRNKRCETKPRRQRILAVRLDLERRRAVQTRLLDTSRIWRAAASGVESCVSVLFSDPPPKLATAVCRAIVDAERAARAGSPDCGTFNIEGAVAIPGSSAAEAHRIWIGLRNPGLGDQAVLLRLPPGLPEFRFDGIATAELGGAGFRELSLRDGAIWGIAGPRTDRSDGAFRAFRLDPSRLEDGARIAPEWLPGELPPSSESIVFDGDTPIVLMDGDRGAEGARVCLVPSRQARIEAVTPRP
jgi:hypothetical protein